MTTDTQSILEAPAPAPHELTEEQLFGEVRDLVHGDPPLARAREMADEAWRREREGLPRVASYLRASVARRLRWLGFEPRRWQTEAIVEVRDALEQGARGIVRATTGSGKSLLQAEVVAELVGALEPHQRIVVSAPTQKLVAQLGDTLERRCPGMVGRYYQYDKEVHRPVIVTCHASMWDATVLCPECHPHILERAVGRVLEGAELKRARLSFEEAAIGGDTARCAQAFQHTEAHSVAERLTRELLERDLAVAYWIADECHKTECDQVLGFAEWVRPQYAVGFTATPWRAEEHESLSLFDELLYDYGPSQAIQDGVVIRPTIVAFTGEATDLDEACLSMIRDHLEQTPGPGVVSADSIDDADAYASFLCAEGVRAASIHSRLGRDEQATRLELLRTGDLDCLVHVCLLAEGVDLPWLSWLCLRRSSASRVRFCQEVGRVIRTYPGKRAAHVFDPHDLFGRLSLDYAAVLGGESEIDEGPQAELDQLAREIAKLFTEEDDTTVGSLDSGATWRGHRRLEGMDLVRAWLRQTALGYRLMGYDDLKLASRVSRTYPSTDKQVGLVDSLLGHSAIVRAAGTMSEEQRTVMREAVLAARASELNRGDVSDLITILQVLKRHAEIVRLEDSEEVAT